MPRRTPGIAIEQHVPEGPWDHRAPCKGVDPDLFYNEAREAEAKAMCADCSCSVTCLEWALARKEHGVWGGTTQQERVNIIRRRRRHRAA